MEGRYPDDDGGGRKRTYAALEAENERLHLRLADCITKLRAIQEKEGKKLEGEARWQPKSKPDIVDALEQLLDEIKMWSKRWAIQSDGRPVDCDLAECARRLGPDLAALFLPAQTHGRKAASWLVLNAATASFACHHIVGNPFFAFHEPDASDFDASSSRQMYRHSDGASLARVVRFLSLIDVAIANAMRCQIMRLLNPLDNDTAAATHTISRAKTARSHASAQAANHIISQKASFLLADPDGKACAELTNIFTRLAAFSATLWVQKWRLDFLGYRELQNYLGVESETLVFNRESKHLKIHALNRKHVVDDPAALDGGSVVLLTSPVMVATGTMDGGPYDIARVWLQAVALVG